MKDKPKASAQQRRGHLEQSSIDRSIRRRLRRAGLGIVASGAVLAGGIVSAAPLPAPDQPAQFGQTRGGLFADTTRAVVTPEGWVLRSYLYAMDLRSVIPLGRGLNSYESFVSASGKATIDPKDRKNPPKIPVKSATINVGLTLACPVSPQQLQISGTASNAVNGSVTPSLSGTVGGTAGGSGGSNGGQGNGSVNASVTPSLSGTLGDTVTTSGTISGTLAPGQAKDFPIAKKTLQGTAGYVTTRETRAAMDGCMGGVQVRMYATATISTALGDSSTTTYSKPIFIERDNPGPARKPPTVKITEDKNPAPLPGPVASKPEQKPAAPAPKPDAKPAPKPAAAPAPKPAPKAPAAAKPAPAKPAPVKPAAAEKPTPTPAPAGR
ncbi:MspA family porin [Tsukamurella pulmonis]|uniref:MspA family porin n=1 Tax=Tsukamurella pulmonis TaxID=47312 RepID=UPI0015869FB5|nr:MspA family porin [Tsukamurella pulmonis]